MAKQDDGNLLTDVVDSVARAARVVAGALLPERTGDERRHRRGGVPDIASTPGPRVVFRKKRWL